MLFHCSVDQQGLLQKSNSTGHQIQFCFLRLAQCYSNIFCVWHSWNLSYQSFWENKFTTSVLTFFLLSSHKMLFFPNCYGDSQKLKGQQVYFKIIPDTFTHHKHCIQRNKMCLEKKKKKQCLKSSPEVVALQFKQDFFFPLS